MKKFLLIPCLLLAFTLAMVGNSFANGNVENGAKIFKKKCKMCHNKDGSKSSMSKAIIGSSEEVIQTSIKGGRTGLNKSYSLMVKTLKKKTFSDQDLADITAFLNK